MNQINEYYQLGINANQKALLVFVARNDREVDPLRFYSGEIIIDWPSDISFTFSRLKDGESEDILDGGLHWVLVSDRFYQTCKENNVQGVQLLPVSLIDPTTEDKFAQYWVINVIQNVDALDYESTTWNRKDTKEMDEYPLLKILNPVFRKDKLAGIDIFRLRIGLETGTTIYISHRLKSLLEKNKATKGVWFGKIRVI